MNMTYLETLFLVLLYTVGSIVLAVVALCMLALLFLWVEQCRQNANPDTERRRS